MDPSQASLQPPFPVPCASVLWGCLVSQCPIISPSRSQPCSDFKRPPAQEKRLCVMGGSPTGGSLRSSGWDQSHKCRPDEQVWSCLGAQLLSASTDSICAHVLAIWWVLPRFGHSLILAILLWVTGESICDAGEKSEPSLPHKSSLYAKTDQPEGKPPGGSDLPLLSQRLILSQRFKPWWSTAQQEDTLHRCVNTHIAWRLLNAE